MHAHTIHRTTALLGFALGVPLVAVAASALAAADPDSVAYSQISFNGPGAGQQGTNTFTGVVKDVTASTVGPHGDGVIGTWNATDQYFAGLSTATNTSGYELYADGTDTHHFIEMYSSSVYSDLLATELWGSYFTEELNSSGTVIGMSEVIDLGGQDFTLFDTLPNGD